MNTTTPEKEWLQRFGNNKCQDDAVKNQKEAAKESNGIHSLPKHQGTGFADVAGMNQLKELVIEGFINVLRNRDCAEAYGIKPPSLLFYGPAGCGKTFFAEKIAEELGIHFMKIDKDTLELSEIILALADDLSTGCMLTTSLCMPQGTPEGKQWFERYVLMKPANIGRSCQLYTDKCTS